MECEIRKITYVPEVYDKDTGELKKEAYFTVNIDIESSTEARQELMEVMAGGTPDFTVELKPRQSTFAGVPSVTQAKIQSQQEA